MVAIRAIILYLILSICSIRLIFSLSAPKVEKTGAMIPVTLITFDVDGTLVKGVRVQGSEVTAHSKAFMNAAGIMFAEDSEYEKKFPAPLTFIPEHKYHGCTDGLIMLNLIKYAFDVPTSESGPKLRSLFHLMYDYIQKLDDKEVSNGIKVLPGVTEKLTTLASMRENVICGLVTGNVEGIARKKMRACGIIQTGGLSPKALDQDWDGENDDTFLGGFGSDFCSMDIEDETRLYKDRGEQIAIACKRALTLLRDDQKLVKVVHVGDAPNDVLAAKWCSDQNKFGPNVTVGCIAVATGSYSPADLEKSAGAVDPGVWEPIVLADGINDPRFIDACGIIEE